ncbi:MAG TPA: site-specific integrase [Candidatus Sulfotelmatobacter sp.]|nr:site-specific integrase [Candidatus Sulfotelmatobacter sp.]
MDIVNNFKIYLFSQKNPPSAITIKNYIADIRKFINWYQTIFEITFIPSNLTAEVITQYKKTIRLGNETSLPAARSAKRYLSSLRKFSSFLETTGVIVENPFTTDESKLVDIDPYFLKEFKNYLYTEQASRLTIKNYLTDIKQFLNWLELVTIQEMPIKNSNLILMIDNNILEQYKMRLYNEAKLSPISINRKLSSLRRYIRWLGEKGILNMAMVESTLDEPEIKATLEESKPITSDVPLIALQGLAENKIENEQPSYSRFAPLRLFQKITKFINLGTDLLLFNPLAHSAEAIQYLLWKKSGRKIFAPVTTIIETSSYMPKNVSIKTIIPKSSSTQAPRSANLSSVLKKIRSYNIETNPNTVHNFAKALYAPLDISTKHMHWSNKLLHNLRYIRPNWYKKYHTYAFAHYLHLSILLIATIITGTTLYKTWNINSIKQHEAVLSAQTVAPPRKLSFQGKLLDNTNTPITAETPLRFALYNNPTASGEALLWQERQDIKPDQNGYFSATLGKITRLDQNLFTDNQSLYIGISVNGKQELSPRQQIPTANFAANSQSVEGLKPITNSPDLAQNVLLALDSAGNLTIGGTESHTFQATGGKFNVSGQALLLTTNQGSNGNIKIAPDGSGIIDIQKPLQNTSNYSSPGGIPGAVEIKDILSILATSSSQSALVVNQIGTGDIISSRYNGIDKFRLDHMGNAFLGGDIILNGDTIGTTSRMFDIGGSNVSELNLGNSASVVSIGGNTGMTSINNNITVHGESTFTGNVVVNSGITIPDGQKITLANYPTGAIPFVNDSKQVVQNAGNFSWNDTLKQLRIDGSICLYTSTACDSAHATTGTIYFNNANAFSGDIAEEYVSSQNLEPGDVVVLEGSNNNNAIIKSSSPYQHQLVGIISTKPGFTLNSEAQTDQQHPNMYPLALQGRVPVKVSNKNGPILAGDDLTSSTIPGVAMKATESGQIIGKALEAYNNSDPTTVGKIMIFVNLSYQNSPTSITNNGNLTMATKTVFIQNKINSIQTSSINISQLLGNIANTISLGAIQAQTITTQSLQVATDNIMIGEQTLKQYITIIAKQLINQELDKRLSQLHQNQPSLNLIASNSANIADQKASSSASLIPISTRSAIVQITNNKTASVSSPIYNSIASTSATTSLEGLPITNIIDVGHIASDSGALNEYIKKNQSTTPLDARDVTNTHYLPIASLSGQLNYIPNLKSDFATFNQGLIALGPTSLTDVSISNSLNINNNLKITANSFDTIASDLNIQPLKQGNILFMGGLVAIDTQGNLNMKGNATFSHNITVNGQLAAGIIAPIPNQDIIINLKNKTNNSDSNLIVTSATGSAVIQINQSGDITSSGEARFNTVTSNGFSIIRGVEADTSMTETIANESAGKGVITAYENERTIITPYVTNHSLIYVTATSDTRGVTPYLTRQTVESPTGGIKGSFTVAIPVTVTKDISFNWWIVN